MPALETSTPHTDPDPQDDPILATAGQGPIATPYQVINRQTSFNLFGGLGTLSRSVEECATSSDNITVFRIDTSPLQLENVGKDTRLAASPRASRSPSTGTSRVTARR